jgi:HD-GYP domain-containing protein (c-di-GMP phosphodiesterase class II)
MIINPEISQSRVILSLSKLLDYIHPNVIDHQQRVGYIAAETSRQLGFSRKRRLDLVTAAILHDIGLIGVENRIRGLKNKNWETLPWHSRAGYYLLKQIPLFQHSADIVRYHHTPWDNGRGSENNGNKIPFSSHILVLADSIERMIDRNKYVLDQKDDITSRVRAMSLSKFHPDCVDAFLQISESESFWLDCVSSDIENILTERIDWSYLTIDKESLESIAKLFAEITDATSAWTATHSKGVATAAVEISKRCKLSPRELSFMCTAGYFHDIGKLTIPSRILDKPGKLSPHERSVLNSHTYYTFHILNTIGGMQQISEWAAFHHERLDGKGYPFQHTGENLTLGARIMAVADVFGALTEDRPYHKAMSQPKVMQILKKLAGSNGLDGDIVDIIEKDYDTIYYTCMQQRADYNQNQQYLLSKLHAKACHREDEERDLHYLNNQFDFCNFGLF